MMTTKKTTQYIKTTLRVPESLWRRVRIHALETGTTAEALVSAALESYLGGVAHEKTKSK
jgi:hypothetical protein